MSSNTVAALRGSPRFAAFAASSIFLLIRRPGSVFAETYAYFARWAQIWMVGRPPGQAAYFHEYSSMCQRLISTL